MLHRPPQFLTLSLTGSLHHGLFHKQDSLWNLFDYLGLPQPSSSRQLGSMDVLEHPHDCPRLPHGRRHRSPRLRLLHQGASKPKTLAPGRGKADFSSYAVLGIWWVSDHHAAPEKGRLGYVGCQECWRGQRAGWLFLRLAFAIASEEVGACDWFGFSGVFDVSFPLRSLPSASVSL